MPVPVLVPAEKNPLYEDLAAQIGHQAAVAVIEAEDPTVPAVRARDAMTNSDGSDETGRSCRASDAVAAIKPVADDSHPSLFEELPPTKGHELLNQFGNSTAFVADDSGHGGPNK